MRFRRTPLLLCLLLGFTLVLTTPAAPQEEDDDYTFFDSLDVQVVSVEVIVTETGGEPVLGLTRDDFELTEDGQPVEITNFYSVDVAPPQRAETPEAAQPAGGEAIEPHRLTPPVAQDLHLALFVDGTSLQPIGRRRVFDAIREVFSYQQAKPTSLILATFDGNLEIQSFPGFEPDLLNANLDILEKAAPRGSLPELERRSILADMQRTQVGTGGGMSNQLSENNAKAESTRLLQNIQSYANQRYSQAKLSAEALHSLVEALAGLPGRKALLYLSGGLARNPGEALFYAWENRFGSWADELNVQIDQRARQFDTTPELRRLIRHANANRVTFYTVAAGRGGADAGVSAEDGGMDVSATNFAGGGRNWSADIEAIDRANQGGTLRELAAATGGLSMTNSRNYGKLLSAMNRDFGGYYSLGYIPDRGRDGKNHRLRVRVKGRKVDIRHREHYRELTRQEIMSGRTRSAVLLGSRENPLEVAMEFGNTAPTEDGYLVPVMVKVPIGKLVLVPRDDVHVGRIGIFICARDGKGRTSPVQSIDVPVRVPNQQLLTALGQVAGYRMVLQIRPEEHSIAVGVRDELGRVESTVTDLWSPPAPVG